MLFLMSILISWRKFRPKINSQESSFALFNRLISAVTVLFVVNYGSFMLYNVNLAVVLNTPHCISHFSLLGVVFASSSWILEISLFTRQEEVPLSSNVR